MDQELSTIILAVSALGGLSIAALTGLVGWRGWLELKKLELSGSKGREPSPALDRIEVADLRERVRNLESIASCIDL
jgi:hypothetical protein